MTTPLDIALTYLDVLGRDDPDAVADMVSVDFRNEHQSALGSGCVGREEYRNRLPGFFTSFPGRSYEVVETTVGSSLESTPPDVTDVVVRYRFTTTVDGHDVDIPGVMWISVVDGEVVRRLDSWDSLTFLRQTDQA